MAGNAWPLLLLDYQARRIDHRPFDYHCQSIIHDADELELEALTLEALGSEALEQGALVVDVSTVEGHSGAVEPKYNCSKRW